MKSSETISFATLNIRGLNSDIIKFHKNGYPVLDPKLDPNDKIPLLMQILKEFDLLVLTETKLNLDNQNLLSKMIVSHYSCHTIDGNNAKAGVSLFLNKNIFTEPKSQDILKSNIIIVDTTTKKCNSKLNIIGYYNNNVNENGKIYKKLMSHIKHNTIILGDFNESLYIEDKSFSFLPSNFDSIKSKCDKFRLNFKIKLGLHELSNGKSEFTYEHSNGTKSVIDYIFVSKNLIKKTKSVYVKNSIIGKLDHKLVCAKIQFRNPFICSTTHKEFVIPPNIFSNKPLKKKINKKIKEILSNDSIDPLDKHLIMSNFVHKACRSKVLNMINDSKKKIKKLCEKLEDINIDVNMKNEIRIKIQKIETKSIRKHNINKLFERSSTFAANKKFSNLINSKLNKPKTNDFIFDIKNEKLSGIEAANYIANTFAKVYQAKKVDYANLGYFTEFIKPFPSETSIYLDSEITQEEVGFAIKRLPFKSPGALGVPVAFYKTYSKILIPYVTKLANIAKNQRMTPKELLVANITMIPKQNKDPHQVDNLRPIFVLEPLRKWLELIMQKRIYHALTTTPVIGDYQNCHPKRNIEDNILSHLFISQYSKETNTKIFCLLTDFRKAFDLVQHDYIEALLSKYNMKTSTINFIMSFLKGEGRIKFGNHKSDPFFICSGTPQGSVLSPFTFILVLEPLLSRLFNEILGVKINTLELKLKAYADDINLYFLSKIDLQNSVNIINLFQPLSGSELNYSKCSIIELGEVSKESSIANIKISRTPERILGVMFDSNGIVNNFNDKLEEMTTIAIVIKKFYPSFNMKVSYWKTYIQSKILFLCPYNVANKKQIEKYEELKNWFLFNKKDVLPTKTTRDIVRLHNSVNNGGKNLFGLSDYLYSKKTRILMRCTKKDFQNKTYIGLLNILLNLRFNKQSDKQIYHPLLRVYTNIKEKWEWITQAKHWYYDTILTITYQPTMPKEIIYNCDEKVILKNNDLNVSTHSFPCSVKNGLPKKCNSDRWINTSIVFKEHFTKKINNTRNLIKFHVKESDLTSSQKLFISEGFVLKRFFHKIKTSQQINDFRTNCALNKYGIIFHYKNNDKCKHCGEKNNSMHIIYCNYFNYLEIKITNKNKTIERIISSKNHKSPMHAHSWAINRARWDTNNKLLYDNDFTHDCQIQTFLKYKLMHYEYQHLNFLINNNIKISKEVLDKLLFYDVIKNVIVPKE